MIYFIIVLCSKNIRINCPSKRINILLVTLKPYFPKIMIQKIDARYSIIQWAADVHICPFFNSTIQNSYLLAINPAYSSTNLPHLYMAMQSDYQQDRLLRGYNEYN